MISHPRSLSGRGGKWVSFHMPPAQHWWPGTLVERILKLSRKEFCSILAMSARSQARDRFMGPHIDHL